MRHKEGPPGIFREILPRLGLGATFSTPKNANNQIENRIKAAIAKEKIPVEADAEIESSDEDIAKGNTRKRGAAN